MQLSVEQLAGAQVCLDRSKRLVAVTGPAGTGKTTLIKHLSEELEKQGRRYAVAAPTGKAAKRIREATGLQAVTVHKLLEYGRPGERDKDTGLPIDITVPKRGKFNPFSQTDIIVDEYSMVTHELNRNIIDALPAGGRLIMFGDIAQLPPVEEYQIKNANGSPFKEHLARPGCVVQLTNVFRQVEGSGILAAANQIRKGLMPRQADDFRMKFTDDPVKVLREYIYDAQDNGVDFGSITNQILTPLKTRWIGTGPLNVMLRDILNPEGGSPTQLIRYSWDEKNPVTVSIGDKVVCTENTYDMRDYTERFTEWNNDGTPQLHSFIPTPETKYMLNGETGKVIEIYPDGGMEVDFGDRCVEIPISYVEWWAKKGIMIDTYPQRSIDLAYALTVHKAQGSEYDNVVYVTNQSIFYMLSRENVYTAVTRARKNVQMICDMKSLTLSLKTTQDVLDKRRTTPKGSLIKK